MSSPVEDMLEALENQEGEDLLGYMEYHRGQKVEVELLDLLTSLGGTYDYPPPQERAPLLDRLLLHTLEDPQMPALLSSVAAEGVREPLGCVVREGQLLLGNGHHRLAAALVVGVEVVPVYVEVDDELSWEHTGGMGWVGVDVVERWASLAEQEWWAAHDRISRQGSKSFGQA